MPFKLNHDRRCRIPRQEHRVTNSAAYDAALRQRGSLTVWFTDAAIAGWCQWRAEPRTTPGGQPSYSSLAILTALTLRAAFRLALRQTEGLIGSIIGLLGLELRVPDHSTLSRRAKTLEVPRPQPRRDGEPLHLLVDSTGLRLCGAGEWLLEKHGTKTRRSWRKLHIGLDAGTGQIVAVSLTGLSQDWGRNIVGLDPSGSKAGASRCSARNSPRLRHTSRLPAPDIVTIPNLATVPMPPPGQGLGMSQPIRPGVSAMGAHPPHAPKALPSHEMISDEL